jgi:YhcH/YjgK/YiaL family protein
MIIDTLQNRRMYYALQPGIEAGFEYLASFDPAVADGRYPIRGDEVFALVQSYETGPGTEKRFETHRRHIDIQFIVSGRERILHLPFGSLEVETSYDEERDVVFYHDPPASSSVLLQPGDFAIFHPEDAHKGGCMAGARDPVRKVVVKVRVGS